MAAASTWSVTPSQANTNGQEKTKIGCMGSKQKKTKQIHDQTGTNTNNNNNQTIHAILPPREGRPVELLWQT
ncbi:unnamed protein product, partial [Rotaria magnacalcarata]